MRSARLEILSGTVLLLTVSCAPRTRVATDGSIQPAPPTLTSIRDFHAAYPPRIAVVGVQGVVRADLAITASGEVDSGDSKFVFTNAAFLPPVAAHLAELRFRPARANGHAVAGRAVLVVRFAITAKECPATTPVTRIKLIRPDSMMITTCRIDPFDQRHLSKAQRRTPPTPPAYYDSAATVLGLIPLSSSRDSRDTVEIRVWSDVALAGEEQLIRLVKTGGRVSGNSADFWRISRFSRTVDLEALRKRELTGCGPLLSQHGIEGCWSEGPNEVDLRPTWDSIATLGVFRLPDQRTLPRDFFLVNDGFGAIVEIRKGKSYRWYSYSNPDATIEKTGR